MARLEFYMKIPGCSSSGCPVYVNNNSEKNYVKSAKGRKLYWGERYCLHGRRARQFHKSVGALPSWCPRRIRYPIIRIYTGCTKTYFEELFDISLYRPCPDRYHLCRITTTMSTPLQFSNKVRNRNTNHYELLGWFPTLYDVIEIDVGLTRFYIWLSTNGWKQTAFDPDKADSGTIGEYQLLPHQDLEPCRYDEDNTLYRGECLGHVVGYFAGGIFRSRWIDNQTGESSEGYHEELENMLFLLQTQGMLKSLEDMKNYCQVHWWARLDCGVTPKDRRQYGFSISREQYSYYLRLAPAEDSPWNILIFVYPVVRTRNGSH